MIRRGNMDDCVGNANMRHLHNRHNLKRNWYQ